MKYYSVKLIEKTVSEILVAASSKKEAEVIAQMDHCDPGHGEVFDQKYKANKLEERPLGRIIMTGRGYIDANDKFHINNNS